MGPPDVEGAPAAEAAATRTGADAVGLLLLLADEALETLLLPVADRTLFSSEPIDSSLCHLELSAALICVHSSFLHDFDLRLTELGEKIIL